MTKPIKQAKLVLEDGSEYPGWSFGGVLSRAGEVVFTTAMNGYLQYLTDPGYRGQILVSSYPLVGNCGVPLTKNGEPVFNEAGIPVHFESSRIQVSGFVVFEPCGKPSHYTCSTTLSSWLEKNNVPGIYGIDTRALTIRLRNQGVMMGKIVVEGSNDVSFDSGMVSHPVPEVSPVEVFPMEVSTSTLKGAGLPDTEAPVIVLIDCGAKAGIIRCLIARGVRIIRIPWNHDPAGLNFDGIILSGGPGDPKACGKTIAMVRRAFGHGKPVFGIGLGCQIMALAAGADTYKLPYGHRGQTQPCIDMESGRCYITSQNHGFAIRSDTLPSGWEPWFINNNDNTIEGIRSTRGPFRAVQFYPEGCPGPRDTEFLFDRFIEEVRGVPLEVPCIK
ncbi:MAG: glutamine-hydrolyzing carbamoyl-phosphate synthase small subunit [Treponema sp.]|jgi:carbamoyl-phosphate synthase small subunit|nr:glutamine-hydrolyzing carbamoyl-phosphate synthase small subunit [Treponema sp.]